MDNPILVDINMFTMNQRIYMPDGEQIVVTMKELPEAIVKACYASNNFFVEIVRGNTIHTKRMSKLVAEKENAKYNSAKIKFKEYGKNE